MRTTGDMWMVGLNDIVGFFFNFGDSMITAVVSELGCSKKAAI